MLRKLLFGFTLLLPATAQATSDEAMQAAFRLAISVVEEHSAYRNVPPVRFWMKVPDGQMSRIAMRYDAGGDTRDIVALFVCDDKAMYLSETLDPNDYNQLGVVVHEMVHHAQCAAGRYLKDICPAEREAYRVEAAFHRSLVTLLGIKQPETRAKFEATAQALEATGEAACRAARNR
jgi:hypothetical protein